MADTRGIDLLNEIADRLGWPQITTIDTATVDDETRKLKLLLNRVLRTILSFDDWPLLQKDGEIVLVAAEKGSTNQYVTATQNSDTITISNASFDTTYKERAIQVGGDEYIYRIKDVLSPTQLQLNRAWINSSITVSDERSYTIAQDRYALPSDFGRAVGDLQSFFAPYDVEHIDPPRFREIRRDERDMRLGDPESYTLYGMNEAETTILLHFHPWPENARLIPFTYIRIHPVIDSDNDKILFPVNYHEVIISAVIYLSKRDYENDLAMQRSLEDYLREYNMQQANPGATGTRPRLRPDFTTRSDIRKAYGYSGLRVNWGSWFDRSDFYGIT